MRLIGAMSIVFTLVLTLVMSGAVPLAHVDDGRHDSSSDDERGVTEGRGIFRFDTFGDEQLWTDVLRMHEVGRDGPSGHGARRRTQGRRRGGAANCRSPRSRRQTSICRSRDHGRAAPARCGRRASKARVNRTGQLTSLGITCALCHSTVDDSFVAGHR